MAVINYDNAIELSITTYLSLDPKQRNGRSFSRDSVNQWLGSYHAKLDFLEHYVAKLLDQVMPHEKDDIIYYHKIRNELYHANGALVPRLEDVGSIREIALWVFQSLYGVDPGPLITVDADAQPVEVPTTNELSPENQVFATLLELRRDIAQLRHESSGRSTDDQVVDTVLRSEGAEGDRFKDALKRANQLARSFREERPITASRAELDELIELLQQLKQRVEIPLRVHQEMLAQLALTATLESVRAKRYFVGHVHQAVGSGLIATLGKYLSLICEQPAFRDFRIVLLADRVAIVDQLYDRMSGLDLSRRPVVRSTSQTFTMDVLRNPPGIVVTTTQALRVHYRHTGLSEQTIAVALDVDLSDAHVVARLLTENYVISFTNDLKVIAKSQGNVIGQYSLDQALRDGIVAPVAIEHRASILIRTPRQPGGESIPFDDDVEVPFTGQSPWTQEHVAWLAEDIVEHFTTRRSGQTDKAVVIVNKIDYATRLADALRRTLFKTAGASDRDIAVLTSTLSPEEAHEVLSAFVTQSEPKILICGRSWKNLDMSATQHAYVTCRLTPWDIMSLMGQLSARRLGKANATIVDYAENSLGVDEASAGS